MPVRQYDAAPHIITWPDVSDHSRRAIHSNQSLTNSRQIGRDFQKQDKAIIMAKGGPDTLDIAGMQFGTSPFYSNDWHVVAHLQAHPILVQQTSVSLI